MPDAGALDQASRTSCSMKRFDWKGAVQPGIDSLKAAWAPLLVIQVSGAIIVASYYIFPWMAPALRGVGQAKEAGGVLFAMASGCITGGLVPEMAKALVGKMGRPCKAWFLRTLYTCFSFSLFGCSAFLFYNSQTLLFGSGVDPATVAKKVAFDLFVYVPIVGAPLNALFLGFPSLGYRLSSLPAFLSDRFFLKRIVPIYAPNLIFWGPMLCCVYALPVDLQFVFAQVCSAAWSLIVTLIAADPSSAGKKPLAECEV